MQSDLERVGSFSRLLHVTLRLVMPHLHATSGVVLAPERGRPGLRVVHQLGPRDWEPETAAAILATGRVAVPPNRLYAVLREHGKPVAMLLLSRPDEFSRADLRLLLRAATFVDDRLAELADARVVDVLARIDRKISRELRTVDLLYQTLDGLEALTRYDHSAAILLFDRERSSLEVSAEKIVWRKMKSPHIHRVLPLDRDLAEILQRENRAFVLGRGIDGDSGQAPVRLTVHSLCELYRDDPRVLDAPAAGLASLFELLQYGRESGVPEPGSILLVPLLFGPRLLGLLVLADQQAEAFTPADVLVVGRFVEKLATSIRNAGLYGRRLDELRAINDIGKLVTRSIPLEETCGRILEIVLKVMNLSAGSIEIVDRDRDALRVLADHGYEVPCNGLALGEGITGEVARTGRSILANDVRHHPHYVLHNSQVRSELAVPILVEGSTWGVLNVESHAPDRFRDREVDFLTILADKTATALETLEQRDHRRATLRLLHELGSKLVDSEDSDALLRLTVDLTREHLSCEVASVFLFEDGRFRRRATAGLPADWLPDESYGLGEGLTGRAALSETTPSLHAVSDNAVDVEHGALPEILLQYAERLTTGRIAHLIAVPLVEGDRPVGVLRILNRVTPEGRLVAGGFTDSDVTLLKTLASLVSLAIANVKKRERIQQMSAKLEKQVRQRTAEAHRLASFVENAPLAILEVDPRGVLRFVNEAGERMFGYRADELRDRQVTAEGLGLLGDAFPDLVKVVEFLGFWAGEVTYRRADGGTHPAFLSARALRDANGAMHGMIIFARDVSSTKDLERQLLEAEGKRAMADLAGGVAHDLNNALGSILPMIQALRADLDDGRVDPEQLRVDLEQIESYTRLSVRIFQGMLAMSRGTFAIDKLVDINERARTALDLLSLRLQKAHIETHLELQADLPQTLAHPGRLEQVFHNLIGNAVDAMPNGGTLTVRTWSSGSSVFLEVSDTGAGIPADQLARVQEPFYTSKRHGTGLGLSVVRSIVWEHNGKMSLQSQVGHGTTVTLEFPVRTIAEGARLD